MGEDRDGHSIPDNGAGCSFAVPSFGDGTEPLLSLQAEWRTASVNISFFESFCSTGQHAFNASRETCTVMLTSREPRSQHWAVRAILHREYDPTILPGGEQDGNSVGDPGMRMELEAWPRGSFPWAAPSEWLGRGKMTPELSFAPQRRHQNPLPSMTSQGRDQPSRRKNFSQVVKIQHPGSLGLSPFQEKRSQLLVWSTCQGWLHAHVPPSTSSRKGVTPLTGRWWHNLPPHLVLIAASFFPQSLWTLKKSSRSCRRRIS